MIKPCTISDIVTALGGPTELGRACGFTKHPGARGWDMVSRESIPVEYWPSVIEAARAKKQRWINAEALLAAHAAAKSIEAQSA